MDTENYYTIAETAETLGVSQGTIRVALLAGRLPHTVYLNRKLILKTDVEAYRQRTQPDGEKRVGRPKKAQV